MANNATTEEEQALLDKLIVAFVQGAEWRESKYGFTMWAGERNECRGEAILKWLDGSLGKSTVEADNQMTKL